VRITTISDSIISNKCKLNSILSVDAFQIFFEILRCAQNDLFKNKLLDSAFVYTCNDGPYLFYHVYVFGLAHVLKFFRQVVTQQQANVVLVSSGLG